jgi:hypothetical protein
MKVAITDANIFIDLWELGWLRQLSQLGLEVHTTTLVFMELNQEQKLALIPLIETGGLLLYELNDEEYFALEELEFPGGLSTADLSVLWYAIQKEPTAPIILSGDKLIRNWCARQRIEVHGILWIFDLMLSGNLISPKEAYEKLFALMKSNQWLPRKECYERLERWENED